MKITPTLTTVLAILLIVTGIMLRIYNLPDEQISLMVSLSGVLIYILAYPERNQAYRQKL